MTPLQALRFWASCYRRQREGGRRSVSAAAEAVRTTIYARNFERRTRPAQDPLHRHVRMEDDRYIIPRLVWTEHGWTEDSPAVHLATIQTVPDSSSASAPTPRSR